ncbi:MAG: DUF721 domain-containing protein [Legionellales bacterium]|nr:DUF721 domain-containing protein [Legionellales bacterium]
MNKNPEKSIAQILLDAASQLQPLVNKAQNILALEGIVKQYLPLHYRDYCKVVNFRGGILVLACANGSVATHLRYSSQQLLSDLRQNGLIANLSSIHVIVQPDVCSQAHPHHALPRARISLATSVFLAKQAEECEDVRFKKLLRCLASHTHHHSSHH